MPRLKDEGERRTHILRWKGAADKDQCHEAIVVGGNRPYVNFTDRDICGVVSIEPFELLKIVQSINILRRRAKPRRARRRK